MKIEGYEEISEEEYKKLPDEERSLFLDGHPTKNHYFKKAQKFPINFKIDETDDIDVEADGEMNFNRDDETVFTMLPKEIPILVKVVEKAKEVMKK